MALVINSIGIQYMVWFCVTGEVRDVDGHVSYRIVGAWDTGLELLSVDGKVILIYLFI